MSDKFDRMLAMLTAIQANPGITAKDLARKCEIEERSVYRYIDELRLAAPITNEGRGKGYRFMSNFSMHPLNFSHDEFLAIKLLPSIIDSDKIPPGFESAHDKIIASHLNQKSRQSDLIGDITSIIQMGTPVYRGKKRNPNFLQPIIQAILEQKTIRTEYHTQHSNETKKREIDPYYLVPRDRRFYMIGYCHLAGEIRTFRVTRFHDVKLLDKKFDKGGFNVKQHLKNTWSIDQGDRNVRFKVLFKPDVARYIEEEELFVQPWTKEQPDGSLLFQVTVNNEKEFIRWIMQYGPSAEILEPKSIRDSLRQQLAEWSRMYEN